MHDYTAVSLSNDLVRLIDEKIKGKGYSSRAEFVRLAIRNEIERINQGGI